MAIKFAHSLEPFRQFRNVTTDDCIGRFVFGSAIRSERTFDCLGTGIEAIAYKGSAAHLKTI